jgi:hypothetical protein
VANDFDQVATSTVTQPQLVCDGGFMRVFRKRFWISNDIKNLPSEALRNQ